MLLPPTLTSYLFPYLFFFNDTATTEIYTLSLHDALPIGGKGTGRWSFIHLDDAARATIAAVERGPPGTYNVVDDEPAPISEWLPVYAAALGAPPPRRLPAWLVRMVGGRYAEFGMTQARGASNAHARERLGW